MESWIAEQNQRNPLTERWEYNNSDRGIIKASKIIFNNDFKKRKKMFLELNRFRLRKELEPELYKEILENSIKKLLKNLR